MLALYELPDSSLKSTRAKDLSQEFHNFLGIFNITTAQQKQINNQGQKKPWWGNNGKPN